MYEVTGVSTDVKPFVKRLEFTWAKVIKVNKANSLIYEVFAASKRGPSEFTNPSFVRIYRRSYV